jgi:hypothetical protein
MQHVITAMCYSYLSVCICSCPHTGLTGLPQCVAAVLATVNDGEYYSLKLALPSIAASCATAAEPAVQEVCHISIAFQGLTPSAEQRLWLEV